MRSFRQLLAGRSLLVALLVPAIGVASSYVAWFAVDATRNLENLRRRPILADTVDDAQAKIRELERQIILADNAAWGGVDLDALEGLQAFFDSGRSPALIRSAIVLDEDGSILAFVTRSGDAERVRFRKVFLERILPDLELDHELVGRHRHLHRSYAGGSYLVSYLVRRHRGARHYLCLQVDLERIVDVTLPALFADIQGKRLFSVVDEQQRVVFGRDLSAAGEFVVRLQFPTTLYGWRLDVAPKQAPVIEASAQRFRRSQVSLIALSVATILVGTLILLYAMSRERRASQLKSEFVANVSHELKTPLSLIRMYAELLSMRRARDSRQEADYHAIILREAERLQALIENLLDFSRMERGKLAVTLERHEIGPLVARAVELFRHQIDPERSALVLEIEDGLGEIVVDEQALTLALLNLLDNAVKYGPPDGEVRISATRRAAEVRLSIVDRGGGLRPDEQKRIFERFYRGENAKLQRTRGSGIGLALVKSIVLAHDGRVEVDSVADRGTTFTIVLPVPREKREVPQGDPQSPQSMVGPAGSS
ncbi:MAG: HAMP domain-containing histidine kinase [Deltaproteobacteria bacterium]|nr:HAMP domain-containing histidine kinase [Deltaproteobacteria bacterium]